MSSIPDPRPSVVRLDAHAHALAEQIVQERNPFQRERLVDERFRYLRPNEAVRRLCGLCGHPLAGGAS